MKTQSLFQKKTISFMVIIASGLLLNSCNKDEFTVVQDKQNDTTIMTRAASEFHWRCPDSKCGFLNPGWRNDCAACHKPYNKEHGNLLLSIVDFISVYVPIGGGGGRVGDDRLIELPSNLFPQRAPEAWYESPVALKFYNELKTMNYLAIPEYAAGVDFGWYRTVRVLYPRISDITQVENRYDKWLVNDGLNLRGQNGSGIKNGSNAAIKAFKASR